MGLRGARLWIASAVLVASVAGAGLFGYSQWADRNYNRLIATRDLAKMAEESYSDVPSHGLAVDWVDCLETHIPLADASETRIACRTWTVQGVTNSLVALRSDAGLVPVVESRMDAYASNGVTIVDVIGGPAGDPFALSEMHTREWVKKMRRLFGAPDSNEGSRLNVPLIEERAYFQALKRGFTIASVGYWGTRVRTLREADEFALAAADVRAVIDHYRDATGAEPPILATSLGTHITLAALGAERLQSMHAFVNVPVMTGLQGHLKRTKKRLEQAVTEGEDPIQVSLFNVYKRSDEGTAFDYSKMLKMSEYITAFVGEADYPWTQFEPKSPCSRIVLGLDDPRTKDYFERTPRWSSLGYVIAVTAGHDIERDAPDVMRGLVARFSDCVLEDIAL